MADDAIEVNDGGTPLLDYDTAHVPEAREDIPPMQRIGMPLYDPALYEAPPDETGPPVVPAPEAESVPEHAGRERSPEETDTPEPAKGGSRKAVGPRAVSGTQAGPDTQAGPRGGIPSGEGRV
jgi:hypothetical protein